MTDIKMSNIVVLLIGMAIIVNTYLFVQFKNNNDEGKLLYKTLKSSGAVAGKVSFNGWKRLTGHSSDDAVSTLKEIGEILYQDNLHPPIKTSRIKHSTEITMNGNVNPELKARLTLIQNSETANAQGEQLLVLSLEGDSTAQVFDAMEKAYKKVIGDDGQKSIVVSGFMEGDLSPLQKDTVLRKMFKEAGVQKVEKLETGPLVSLTGYSPNVRSQLTLAGKSVNINMALRYNSVQNRTMVYIGSPVITSEY